MDSITNNIYANDLLKLYRESNDKDNLKQGTQRVLIDKIISQMNLENLVSTIIALQSNAIDKKFYRDEANEAQTALQIAIMQMLYGKRLGIGPSDWKHKRGAFMYGGEKVNALTYYYLRISGKGKPQKPSEEQLKQLSRLPTDIKRRISTYIH